MAKWNNVLTSGYHNCNGNYSYPTTNHKKLFNFYSLLLCSISKLHNYYITFYTFDNMLHGRKNMLHERKNMLHESNNMLHGRKNMLHRRVNMLHRQSNMLNGWGNMLIELENSLQIL